LQSNALKFTQGGEVEIIVQIIDKFLQISVRDTGVGISKENQEKLFKFFGFIKETKDMNKNGVGLGLAISKQIVEQYNGTIDVESEPDVGSTFTYCIQLDDPEEIVVERKNSQYALESKTLYFAWKADQSL
jgi:two-component system sensor histidine kinase/response regulator